MKQSDTISVNGQLYDKKTGLPVAAATSHAAKGGKGVGSPRQPRMSVTASTQHSTAKRSKTLRRAPVSGRPASAPAAPTEPTIVKPKRRPAAKMNDIAPHPQVGKFATPKAKKAQTSSAPTTTTSADIAPRQHPHTLRTAHAIAQKKQPKTPQQPISAKVKKDAEIHKALEQAKTPPKGTRAKVKKQRSRRRRTIHITAIVLAIGLAIGIVAWMSLPAISIRIASSQAGITASLPHFIPDGYRLSIPIEAKKNRAAITFTSNQNNTSFTISQEGSSWDSQAVRLMVEEKSNGQFLTTQDRGLTIYTHDGNAAWVNKGILYQISGDARLSNDTIKRIVASL